jgi:hypothetical protein
VWKLELVDRAEPEARASRPRELVQPRRMPGLLVVLVVTWADTSVGAMRCVAALEEVVQQARGESTEVLRRLREGVEGATGMGITDG